MTKELKDIYRKMASAIDAKNNCAKMGNAEWYEEWDKRIRDLIDELPHGSGIDCEWILDEKSNGEKIILYNSYHAMNENGMYDGYCDFKLVVEGSLQFGIKIKITGNFGKYQEIKDYLYDVLQ